MAVLLMDDRTKTAFASASDCAKQLITLCTAILTLEVSFAKNILETPDAVAKGFLVGSWILFLFSIVGGVWTLLALTGTLGSQAAVNQAAINASNVRWPAIIQIVLFVAGLLATVLFGCTAL